MQEYIIIVVDTPSLTTSKVILFYAGISAIEKRVRFIFELLTSLLKVISQHKLCDRWAGIWKGKR